MTNAYAHRGQNYLYVSESRAPSPWISSRRFQCKSSLRTHPGCCGRTVGCSWQHRALSTPTTSSNCPRTQLHQALFIKKKKKKDFFIHNLTAHGVKLITCVKHFIFWQGSSNLAEGYSPFFVSRDFHVRFLMMLIIFLSKFECVTKHSRKHRILFYPVAVRGVTLTHAFF